MIRLHRLALRRFGFCRGGDGQFDGEAGAFPESVAADRESAAQLFCSQGRAVQPEAVAVLARGKPMGKNPGQVFRRDSHAVVGDFDADAVGASGLDANGDLFLGPVTLGSPNDPPHLALGAGAFDVKPSTHPDSETAGELRGEYRFGDVLSIISPFVGASVTTDGATYVYGGFGFDINLSPNWVLNPNFAAGYFGPGSGTKLGSSVEFRSGLEVDYRFWDQSRLGLAIQHMSNAGISQRNPGEESVTLIYAIPLGR